MVHHQTAQKEKRSLIRVRYPDTLRPRIVGRGWTVIDLSENGLSFSCSCHSEDAIRLAQLGVPFWETMQFNDGRRVRLVGFITRCASCLYTRRTLCTCRLLQHIPRERICKELALILQEYPKFIVS